MIINHISFQTMVDDDDNSQNLLDDTQCSVNQDNKPMYTEPMLSSGVKHIKLNNYDKTSEDDKCVLEKFPFHGMDVMVGEKSKPHGEDPRGQDQDTVSIASVRMSCVTIRDLDDSIVDCMLSNKLNSQGQIRYMVTKY